ncbi:MAG: hypothetical protein JSW65_05795 [Candidatus Bipolaricaulota bacterium]|nr:MAG: hypothetical protein JSW65_05795 [Candidatus Bipolaricaulota bacterium]
MGRVALSVVGIVAVAALIGAGQGVWSGMWGASLCFDATPTLLGLESTLTVSYGICGWTFAATMGLTESGWMTARFDGAALVGAVAGDLTVVFYPQTASFAYLEGTAMLVFSGVTAEAAVRVEPTGAGWRFGIRGDAARCHLVGLAYFNMTTAGEILDPSCELCFSSAWIEIDFPFGCLDRVHTSLGFTPLGFEGVTFSLDDVPFGVIDWLTFDLAVTFDDGPQGKTLTLTPELNMGQDLCLTLYGELLTVGNVIDGLSFHGAELRFEWETVAITSLSAFDVADPHDLVLDPYWEMLCIGTLEEICCDGDLGFEVCTYFDATSDALFDWGMTSIEATVGIGPSVTVSGSTIFDLSGVVELCLGAGLRW